jgi:phosphoribosylamine--glycine ligase
MPFGSIIVQRYNDDMNLLIVGSGGREHALAWKLAQSPKTHSIYVAPGNAGTAQIATDVPASTTREIIAWLTAAQRTGPRIDFAIIGPDSYLSEGIVDEIQSLGIPVFGPTRAAAELEWSKTFAKELMREEGIPTAEFRAFADFDEAIAYARLQKFPLVIKADGLALGKGVVIAENHSEAENALEEMMQDKRFGDAGSEIVIEEYLHGREISIHAFCDGESAVLFPSSQDHKRIYDGDQGPNTGGMGTVAPVPWVTEEQLDEIREKIVMPTLRAMKKRGRLFKGILYPGIMLTDSGPKVIEFNARFGDPEAQSYMRLLETDLLDILMACEAGTIDDFGKKTPITWSEKSACCIVCASGTYPASSDSDKEIRGLDFFSNKKHGKEDVSDKKDVDEVVIFHAGTKIADSTDDTAVHERSIVTNGGRILGVTATSDNLQTALDIAYAAIEKISFDGIQYRKDIGQKSLS